MSTRIDVEDIIDRLTMLSEKLSTAITVLRDVDGAGQGAVMRKPPATATGTRVIHTPESKRKLSRAMKRRWAVKRAAANQ